MHVFDNANILTARPCRCFMAEAPQSSVVSVEEVPIDHENSSKGVIAKVIINRPEKLNALNSDVVAGLKRICSWAEENNHVRVLVISGAMPNTPPEGKRGKPNSFVAGADITEFVGSDSNEIRERFMDNAIERVWNLSKPTIAMVDGFALGGGCELACSCDLRIGSTRAVFGTPEINLGLIPGYGGTQRLPRLVGLGCAMEMILGGEMVDAKRALNIGLLNHLCEIDELEKKTMEVARNIGSKSPYTIKFAKSTVRESLELPLSKGLEKEAIDFANLFDSEDQTIGVRAFLERTEPEWIGK